MLLAQASPYKMDKSLIDRILDDGIPGIDASTEVGKRDEVILRASALPIFKNYIANITAEEWEKFFQEETAESFVPVVWDSRLPNLDQELNKLLLVKLGRVDRFVPSAEMFVGAVFGKDVLDATGDLRQVVGQVSATTPIALASSPGFGASYKSMVLWSSLELAVLISHGL